MEGVVHRPKLDGLVDDGQCDEVAASVVRLSGVQQQCVVVVGRGGQSSELERDAERPSGHRRLGQTQRHVRVGRLQQRNEPPSTVVVAAAADD